MIQAVKPTSKRFLSKEEFSKRLEELALKYQTGGNREFENLWEFIKEENYRERIINAEFLKRKYLRYDDIADAVDRASWEAARDFIPEKGSYSTYLRFKIKNRMEELEIEYHRHSKKKADRNPHIKFIRISDLKRKSAKRGYQESPLVDIKDKSQQQETLGDREEAEYLVRKIMKELTSKEQRLFYLRYGLKLSLDKTGRREGIYRQIVSKYLKRVKSLLSKELDNPESSYNLASVSDAIKRAYEETREETNGKPKIKRSAFQRKILEQEIDKTLEDTDIFPEKTLARLVLNHQSGDSSALDAVYELTDGLRKEMVRIKESRLPKRIHRMDIETDVNDAVKIAADKFDFSDLNPNRVAGYFREIMYRNMDWLKKIYPSLRKRNTSNPPKPVQDAEIDYNAKDPSKTAEEKEEIEKFSEETLGKLSDRNIEILGRRLQGENGKAITDSIGLNRLIFNSTVRRLKQEIEKNPVSNNISINRLRDVIVQHYEKRVSQTQEVA